jgi:hypothetical protein
MSAEFEGLPVDDFKVLEELVNRHSLSLVFDGLSRICSDQAARTEAKDARRWTRHMLILDAVSTSVRAEGG